VLVVAPQPFYEDRGTPIAVRQLLQALSQLGYEVDVVTFPLGQSIEIPHVRYFRASNPFRVRQVPIGFSLAKVLLDATLISELVRRLSEGGYSCIHALEEAAFPCVMLGQRFRVPVIYDMQSSLPEQLTKHVAFRSSMAQAGLKRAERWLLRHADSIVSSTGLAQRVRILAPDARLREWRFASALPSARPEEAEALRSDLGLRPGQPVVLYSGTFEPYQGLPELVAAIPAVRASVPTATFILVGAERANGLLAETGAEALVASGALRIVDRQPRAEVATYLALADVLVSPRAYGGNLPLKIFDYLAAGRPIVATDIPTHRTVLSEERAVLVAQRTDAIADGILSVLHDPARARQLATAARGYAKMRFGWSGFVDSVEALYAEVERHAPVARG